MTPILALLCLVSRTPVADSFKLVSFQQEIASLEARLHKKITTKRELWAHRLYIREDPSDPLRELRAVAMALRASVEATDTGFSLERKPKEMAAARAAWASRRAKWIQKTIDEALQARKANQADKDPVAAIQTTMAFMLKADEQFGKGDHNAFASTNRFALTPASGLLVSLINRIGAETLGALPTGKSVIYELKVAADGQALPPCENEIRAYEEGMSKAGAIKIPKDFPFPFLDAFAGIGSKSGPTSQIRLRVVPGAEAFFVAMECFGESGQVCGRAFMEGSRRRWRPSRRHPESSRMLSICR